MRISDQVNISVDRWRRAEVIFVDFGGRFRGGLKVGGLEGEEIG